MENRKIYLILMLFFFLLSITSISVYLSIVNGNNILEPIEFLYFIFIIFSIINTYLLSLLLIRSISNKLIKKEDEIEK